MWYWQGCLECSILCSEAAFSSVLITAFLEKMLMMVHMLPEGQFGVRYLPHGHFNMQMWKTGIEQPVECLPTCGHVDATGGFPHTARDEHVAFQYFILNGPNITFTNTEHKLSSTLCWRLGSAAQPSLSQSLSSCTSMCVSLWQLCFCLLNQRINQLTQLSGWILWYRWSCSPSLLHAHTSSSTATKIHQ